MDYLSEKEMITDYARELKINVLQNELEDFYHIGNAGELGMQDIDCTHTGKGNGNKGRETKKTTGKDSRIPADEVFAGAHKRGFA